MPSGSQNVTRSCSPGHSCDIETVCFAGGYPVRHRFSGFLLWWAMSVTTAVVCLRSVMHARLAAVPAAAAASCKNCSLEWHSLKARPPPPYQSHCQCSRRRWQAWAFAPTQNAGSCRHEPRGP